MSATDARKPRLRTYISVDVDVDITDFDEEVILQAARDILAGRVNHTGADSVILDDLNCVESPFDIAHKAFEAIICRDPQAERDLSRKLIGEITGRIL